MAVQKTCPVCRKRLSSAAFNRSSRSADGLAGTCRACTNSRRRRRASTALKRKRGTGRSTQPAHALRNGDVEKIKSIVDGGVKPDRSWVCEAIRLGHFSVAEDLLQLGVTRDVFTMAALADVQRLSRRLSRSAADACLAVSMEPASEGVTPLHIACASDWTGHGPKRTANQIRSAAVLKDYGADLSALARYRGISDATPLFCACWTSRNAELVRWWLAQGVTAGTSDLLAALGHFQRHGLPAFEIADALLDSGVPIDQSDSTGRTPRQVFAHQGMHDAVGDCYTKREAAAGRVD